MQKTGFYLMTVAGIVALYTAEFNALAAEDTNKQPAAQQTAEGSAESDATGEGATIDEATLAQWQRVKKNPDWVSEEMAKHKIVLPADNSDLIGKGQGSTYGNITPQDVAIWERETLKLVVEGSQVFHSAEELGSTIAVSCDMCHPDASNTHAETYPKFQIQLGRVALLRDMINWCIEHPVRGEPLAADDPKMRALEAYIYAQRKGTPLQYGKR